MGNASAALRGGESSDAEQRHLSNNCGITINGNIATMQAGEAEVSNLQGQQVMQLYPVSTTLNLPSGIYIIKYTCDGANPTYKKYIS